MRIVGLKLRNYRIFRELDWEFGDEGLVALIGENGAGKSAILAALGIGLKLASYIIGGKQFKYVENSFFDDIDITTGKKESSVDVIFEDDTIGQFPLSVTATRGNISSRVGMANKRFSELCEQNLKKETIDSVPILMGFGINRTNSYKIVDIPTGELRHRHFYAYLNPFYESKPPFKTFEEWFVAEDTIEIQDKVSRGDLKYTIESLSVIRKAVTDFLVYLRTEDLGDLSVVRQNSDFDQSFSNAFSKRSAYLMVEKNSQEIRLDSLSSGEKGVLILAVEIARRLYLANRSINALSGSGIVLIDEIELHLHPAWQRGIIPALRKTFPNVQFIVTTHSPQTLSTLTKEQIVVVENGQLHTADADPLGRDTNGILEELMDVDKRPEKVDDLIDEVMALLYADKPDFVQAEEKVKQLKPMVAASDPILTRIEALMRRRKALA